MIQTRVRYRSILLIGEYSRKQFLAAALFGARDQPGW